MLYAPLSACFRAIQMIVSVRIDRRWSTRINDRLSLLLSIASMYYSTLLRNERTRCTDQYLCNFHEHLLACDPMHDSISRHQFVPHAICLSIYTIHLHHWWSSFATMSWMLDPASNEIDTRIGWAPLICFVTALSSPIDPSHSDSFLYIYRNHMTYLNESSKTWIYL